MLDLPSCIDNVSRDTNKFVPSDDCPVYVASITVYSPYILLAIIGNVLDCISFKLRLHHKLVFEDQQRTVKDANVHNEDTYEIFDPRNPINKRRREESKRRQQEKRKVNLSELFFKTW